MSRCTRCLAETPVETFVGEDFLCARCAALREDFPLASTPDAKEKCGLCGVGDVADLVTHSGEKIRPGSIVIPVCSSCREKRAEEFRRTLVKMQNGLFKGTWDKDAGVVPEPDEGGEAQR